MLESKDSWKAMDRGLRRRKRTRVAARILLLANGLYWVMFGIEFAVHSVSWVPHALVFEETQPLYCYFGRGLPIEQWMAPYMRLTRLLQWPSFVVTKPFYWYFDSRHILGERIYGGISITGYYLVLVCIFSFLQWFVLGTFVDYVRLRGRRMDGDGA
jgi:hypothetical protein